MGIPQQDADHRDEKGDIFQGPFKQMPFPDVQPAGLLGFSSRLNDGKQRGDQSECQGDGKGDSKHTEG